MLPARDNLSDQLVMKTLEFLRQTLGVSGAMLYWIDPALETSNDIIQGLPEDLIVSYRRKMRNHDPLLASRLVRAGRHIGLLAEEEREFSHHDVRLYHQFMAHYGMRDNIDFLFWDGPTAYAGISLVRFTDDLALPGDKGKLAGLRQYIEATLRMHAHVRAMRTHTILRNNIGLTAREIDVVSLICDGASNRDVSTLLGIGLATVKSYVQQIFDKMGVDNRAALVSRTMRLSMD